MTIHNLKKFEEGLWDWEFLRQCFGGNIVPSDLDGIVERNGQFLVLEGKSSGTKIPEGQQILFENFIKSGHFTVIVLWGESNKPEKMLFTSATQQVMIDPATIKDVKDFAYKWYAEACNHKQLRTKGLFNF
jgi:hypothetical protein